MPTGRRKAPTAEPRGVPSWYDDFVTSYVWTRLGWITDTSRQRSLHYFALRGTVQLYVIIFGGCSHGWPSPLELGMGLAWSSSRRWRRREPHSFADGFALIRADAHDHCAPSGQVCLRATNMRIRWNSDFATCSSVSTFEGLRDSIVDGANIQIECSLAFDHTIKISEGLSVVIWSTVEAQLSGQVDTVLLRLIAIQH